MEVIFSIVEAAIPKLQCQHHRVLVRALPPLVDGHLPLRSHLAERGNRKRGEGKRGEREKDTSHYADSSTMRLGSQTFDLV